MNRIKEKKFLITGVRGFPANKVVKYLTEQMIEVVGIDIGFPTYHPAKMKFYETDPYFSNIEDIIRTESVDIIIHLMFDYDIYSEIHPYNRNNFIRFERLFTLFNKKVFEKLYLFSSIYVYGANFVNSKRYTESDILISSSKIAYLSDMLAIERYLSSNIQPENWNGLFNFRIAPFYHNFSEDIVIKYIKRTPIFYSIANRDPEFQFLYITDLINYIINSVFLEKGGVYNIASPDSIRLSEIASICNKPFVYLPEGFTRSFFALSKLFFKSEIHNSELIDILSFPCLVSIDKARDELGYEAGYQLRDMVENIIFFE